MATNRRTTVMLHNHSSHYDFFVIIFTIDIIAYTFTETSCCNEHKAKTWAVRLLEAITFSINLYINFWICCASLVEIQVIYRAK
jgi:hypothetical protein